MPISYSMLSPSLSSSTRPANLLAPVQTCSFFSSNLGMSSIDWGIAFSLGAFCFPPRPRVGVPRPLPPLADPPLPSPGKLPLSSGRFKGVLFLEDSEGFRSAGLPLLQAFVTGGSAGVGFDLDSLLAGTWELLCGEDLGGDFTSSGGGPCFWADSLFRFAQALTVGGGAGMSFTGSSLCTGDSGLLGSSLLSSPPENTSCEWLDFSLSFLGRPCEGPERPPLFELLLLSLRSRLLPSCELRLFPS